MMSNPITSTSAGSGPNTSLESRHHADVALCHACFEPASLNFPCPHGHCGGIIRYCSQHCRDQDCNITKHDGNGMHSELRCMFLKQHCLGTERIVQIGVHNESFPQYRRLKEDEQKEPEPTSHSNSQLSQQYQPMEGRFCEIPIGTLCQVILLPNEFDAGGSILVKILPLPEIKDQGENYILCDLMALEPPSSHALSIIEGKINEDDGENVLDEKWKMMENFWMQGIKLWYNSQDYLGAMKCFEESLSHFHESDHHNHNGYDHDKLHQKYYNGENDPINKISLHITNSLMSPSPIRRDPQRRLELGQRFCFLGVCYLDLEEGTGDSDKKWKWKGIHYLLMALRIIRYIDDDDYDEYGRNSRRTSFMELMLTFEEHSCSQDNDNQGGMELARLISMWAIDWDCCDWIDTYQRPGYMFTPQDHDCVDTDNNYCDYKPSWCKILEDNYPIIKEELLHQQKMPSSSSSSFLSKNKEKVVTQPLHWPQVGSGEHRSSGQSDHRVVSGGDSGEGDWREQVLFGSGCNTNPTFAPRTKDLIRKYIPEAVTLAEMGGGEVIFSIISPDTHIKPHCASTGNIRLTAHLGLIIPKVGNVTDSDEKTKKLGIRVRDKWFGWEEGKVLIFDDSYEHEVINSTNSCRAVLLLRFWHPIVPKGMQKRVLSDIINKKELDLKRKFVPPLCANLWHVEERAMGWSSCACNKNGYSNVKTVHDIEGKSNTMFQCTCGRAM